MQPLSVGLMEAGALMCPSISFYWIITVFMYCGISKNIIKEYYDVTMVHYLSNIWGQ